MMRKEKEKKRQCRYTNQKRKHFISILIVFAMILFGGIFYKSLELYHVYITYDKKQEYLLATQPEIQVLAPGEAKSVDFEATVESPQTLQEKEELSEVEFESESDVSSSVILEISCLLQNPELPTGCESVALTMVLNTLGYSLEKTMIADQYLVYDSENLAKGYVGDPYSSSGAGVFPPGLTETANRFLRHQHSSLRAYNISGTPFEELYSYIEHGNPILIWTTIDYETPYFSDIINEYQGAFYQWYENEHCVVLGGYDLKKNTVILFDPLQGQTEIEEYIIKNIYDTIGQYAVAIY